MSSPIWVSLTETFTSAPLAAIRSSMRRYWSRAATASASTVTLSPRRSSEAVMPRRLSSRAASTPWSIDSPATNREANRRARPLLRTKLNTPCRSESQSRPCRMITNGTLSEAETGGIRRSKTHPKLAGRGGGV
jgi:hypothetical protein